MQGDPAANRMHAVLDGFLSPFLRFHRLRLPKSLNSPSVSRFRNVARGLMRANGSTLELEEAVKTLNADVAAFEQRADFARWKVDTLLVAALTKPVTDLIDNKLGYRSIVAAWLYENLEAKIPAAVQTELAFAAHMLAKSGDVFIVRCSHRRPFEENHSQRLTFAESRRLFRLVDRGVAASQMLTRLPQLAAVLGNFERFMRRK